MQINRRKFVRIQAMDAPCTVELDGREMEGVIVNESIEGMRVGGIRLESLSMDQKLTLRYRDGTIAGRCRSVSRNEDGSFDVGIMRVDDSYTFQHRCFLLNTFMRSARLNIVCLVEEQSDMGQPDDRISVRLADGKTFVLNRSRVYCQTRRERKAELEAIEDDPEFSEIASYYSLISASEVVEDVESLLDQEFGSEP